MDRLPLLAAGALGGDQRPQALVVLPAGRAAAEMSAEAREARVGVSAGKLELDVFVEQLEALITAHLVAGRPKQLLDVLMVLALLVHRIVSWSVVVGYRHARRGELAA